VEDPVVVHRVFLGNLSVKEFGISVCICQSYDQKSSLLGFLFTV